VAVVYEPDTVSTATIVTRLAQELRVLGHDVAVLTSMPHYNPSSAVRSDYRYRGSFLRPIRVQDENGVRVARCYIPQKPRFVLRRAGDFLLFHVLMAAAATRYFRDREVTIVVSPPFTLALVGMLARRFGGGHLVYNVQELWPDVPRDLGIIRNRWVLAFLAAVERWIYRSSNRVVAIGPGFARTIVARGAGAEDTSVIPNFVDNDRVAPREKNNRLAAAWGVKDKAVVLYAGNIGLTQDFDLLLRAAAVLQDEGVHFIIVGGGAALTRLQEEVRISRPANVELKDFVPAEDVSDLYGLADVILVPLKAGHDRTTTPSKIFSAMAAGRPVIACAAPETDLAETIVQSKAGLVVPAGDHVALANGVMALLDGTADGAWDRPSAIEAARRHSPSAIAGCYDRIIRSLVPVSRGAQ